LSVDVCKWQRTSISTLGMSALWGKSAIFTEGVSS
jgi:hypothetical protein